VTEKQEVDRGAVSHSTNSSDSTPEVPPSVQELNQLFEQGKKLGLDAGGWDSIQQCGNTIRVPRETLRNYLRAKSPLAPERERAIRGLIRKLQRKLSSSSVISHDADSQMIPQDSIAQAALLFMNLLQELHTASAATAVRQVLSHLHELLPSGMAPAVRTLCEVSPLAFTTEKLGDIEEVLRLIRGSNKAEKSIVDPIPNDCDDHLRHTAELMDELIRRFRFYADMQREDIPDHIGRVIGIRIDRLYSEIQRSTEYVQSVAGENLVRLQNLSIH
jgi:hypothetical protein